ncbi:MAG: hypothetical protein Q8834_02885, partial [Candidatus Phytoplasma australasiaticum]|nr:hypothetical protein [Candidatus Phytoplasma australasiaticum]
KEFLWQEGHTVHATKQEALKETLYILNLYKKLCQNLEDSGAGRPHSPLMNPNLFFTERDHNTHRLHDHNLLH